MNKAMKQWSTAAGIILLSAGMLSGCGRTTPSGLIKEAMANVSDASSYTGNLNLSMTMGVKQDGVSMDMEVGMDMDMEATNKPGEYHMNGVASLGFMNMSMEMEMYGKENKDGSKFTTYTNVNDSWTKYEEDIDDASDASDIMNLDGLISKGAKLDLQKDLEEENGKKVYVITTTASGDKMSAAEELLGGISGDSLDELDLSDMEGDVTIKIDKESRFLSSITIDFKDGLGEGNTIEENGVAVSLNNLIMTITFDEFNTVDKINLPKDAINATEMDDSSAEDILNGMAGNDTTSADDSIGTDGDGNYIIRDYGDKKEITIPPLKDFTLEKYSDAYSASFYKEGENYSSISAYYSVEQIDEYYTEEYLQNYQKDDQEYYTSNEEYTNVSFQDVKTVTAGKHKVKYTSLSYAYGDTLYYRTYQAWFLTDDGFAVICNLSESTSDAFGTYLTEEKIIEAMKSVEE